MKIYAASSWRNQRYPNIVAALRAWGHEVYDFTHPTNGDTGFQWSEIDPNWKDWTPEQYRAALNHPIAQRGYRNDKDAMDWADACVLVLPCGRSAHAEAGQMSGEGKPVFVLTQPGEEPELMYKLFESKSGSSRICVSLMDLRDKMTIEEGLRHGVLSRTSPNGATPPQPMATVPEMLRQCAAVYESRAEYYGDNYKWIGKALAAFFPEGLTLQTPDEWNRIALFIQKTYKASRYAQQFNNGGHEDSLVDDSVYSQMLREVDQEIKDLKAAL